jgi:PAS domain S-box-containing protein
MFNDKRITTSRFPVRLFLIVLFSIFVAEASIMLFFSILPSFHRWIETLMDSTLLVIVLFPVLYLFMLRPMALHIRELGETERNLEMERDGLEKRVYERTAELENINEQLETEIGEHKRAGEKLREAETRYRTLFENVPVGLYRTTPGGQILDANSAVVQMLGYPDQETFLKLNAADLYASIEDRVRWQALMNRDGIVHDFEARARRADGTPIWARDTARAVKDSCGQVLYYEGIWQDITEHKKADEAWRQAEEKYRGIFDEAIVGIFQTTPDGRYLSVNPAMAQMYGYDSPEELTASRNDIGLQVYVDPNRREEFKRIMEERGVVEKFEYQVYRKDGSKAWWSENARAVREESGAVLFYVGTVEDITGRKNAEAAQQAAARLEATVTLAAGIAHQFNNLMFAISGNAELLEMKLAGHRDAVQGLTQISKSAQEAGELVQQLLAFARGGKYQPKIMNLNDTIGETLRLQQPSVPRKITVVRDLEPSLWSITSDPTQMIQTIMNLLLNAIEAIHDRGQIRISTKNIILDGRAGQEYAGLNPGPYVCLTVEDSGCGISDQTRARIFEPFFTTKFLGRGLGLAAVHGIVKNHGGLITVSSEEGRGSVFKVFLPAIERRIEKPAEPEHAFPRGSGTILVIEDEAVVRSVVKEFLEHLDYRVLVAGNGQEALDVAQGYAGSIDLALLDMIMPVMNGSEAFPILKQSRPEMKVMLCSGYDLDTAAQSLLNAGAIEFIQKPFPLDVLAQKIRKALGAVPKL